MNLNPISQNDPAWKYTELGFGGTTIGESGCLLVSGTMVIDHGGQDLNPLAVNDLLKAMGRYVESCLLSDDAFNGIHGVQYIETKYYPGPANLSFMQDTYEDEYIIEIDASPAPGIQTHFVRWFDGHTNESIRIYDPWNGTLRHLSDYGNPQTIIQKIIHYRVPNPLTPPPAVEAPVVEAPPVPEPTPVVVSGTIESTHPEVTGNGQPSGDIPVTVITEHGPVLAQPDQPEWVTTYVPKDQDLTLETNAIAVDMVTGDHKEFSQGTKMALAGTFSSNGVSYFRGRTSAAEGKWFGIPTEAFSVLSTTDENNWLLKDVQAAVKFNPAAWLIRLIGRIPVISKLFNNDRS